VTGDRTHFPLWLANACFRRGWVFVSANYRLIPESNAHEILEDLKDAHNYVRTGLRQRLPYDIDLSRIVFAGNSAGGYCALLAASQLKPSPKAVLAVYPVADPSSDRYVTPGNLLPDAPYGKKAKEILAEIDQRIKNKDICVGQSFDVRPDRRTSQYMRYILQEAVYTDYLSGIPGLSKRIKELGEEKAVPKHARIAFPTIFGIGNDFPPTIVTHGTADRFVLFSESERLVAKLHERGVEFEFIPLEGYDHAYDYAYPDVEDGTIDNEGAVVLRKCLDVLDKWVDFKPKAHL
jgi:acetyl esterase/lipase